MVENWLKNNTDKIHVAIYGTKQHIYLLDSHIYVSKNVKDLGVDFECNMTLRSEITKMCQSANCHLKKVNATAKYLPEDTEKLQYIII